MTLPPPSFPGISDVAVAAAGIRSVSPYEAEALCGLRVAGFWIPYSTAEGNRVQREGDGPQGFGRLRLFQPDHHGRRYTQRKGSKPYGYVVPGLLAPLLGQDTLVIVEGEKKALALLDAGVAAVGIGGISLALQDGQLVPGLREVMQARPDGTRVLFLGDGDTSLLFAFSREAVKLAKALRDYPVALPRIGLDGPGKGIDDARAALGADAFAAYWQSLANTAEPVSPDDTPEALAVRLFKRENPETLKKAANGQLS